jgi:hypothetical protein
MSHANDNEMTPDVAIGLAQMITNPVDMAQIAIDLQGMQPFLAALMLTLNDAVQGTCNCDVCTRFREIAISVGGL